MTNKKQDFAALHQPGNPVIIYNVWDAGSAKAVAAAGAKAIATGSWAVAATHGYADGEALPLETALVNAGEVVRAVDVPVSVDFERGYGADVHTVAKNAADLAATDAIGINLEDDLAPIADAAARVRACVDAGLFVNARTDIFIKSDPATHDMAMVESAVERAQAYADAGAGCFFAPFLGQPNLIEQLCKLSPIPVNILMLPSFTSPAELAALGVARVSYGSTSYVNAMAALEAAAREAFSGG